MSSLQSGRSDLKDSSVDQYGMAEDRDSLDIRGSRNE